MGHFRAELVTMTKADELVLSGSPVEYFVHADYQTGDHRTTGTETWGIAGIYDHAAESWVNPTSHVLSVSRDGYTITLSGAHGISVGDLVEVYYYATYAGALEHQAACQIGDVLAPETMDAAVQKINDCPPLAWREAGMTFNTILGANSLVPSTGTTTTTLKYAATQVGTWQTTHTPFYVTCVWIGWAAPALVDAHYSSGSPVDTDDFDINIKVDSGTTRNYWIPQLQHIMMPAGAGGSTYDQSSFLHLGLVEVETDFLVSIELPSSGFAPTTFRTVVSGWCL